MKRTIVYFLFLQAYLALAPSAWASWGSFVSTGTATGVGNPSCASLDRIRCLDPDSGSPGPAVMKAVTRIGRLAVGQTIFLRAACHRTAITTFPIFHKGKKNVRNNSFVALSM